MTVPFKTRWKVQGAAGWLLLGCALGCSKAPAAAPLTPQAAASHVNAQVAPAPPVPAAPTPLPLPPPPTVPVAPPGLLASDDVHQPLIARLRHLLELRKVGVVDVALNPAEVRAILEASEDVSHDDDMLLAWAQTFGLLAHAGAPNVVVEVRLAAKPVVELTATRADILAAAAGTLPTAEFRRRIRLRALAPLPAKAAATAPPPSAVPPVPAPPPHAPPRPHPTPTTRAPGGHSDRAPGYVPSNYRPQTDRPRR